MRIDRPQPVHLPVSRLMDGYLITQLMHIAARLNIADELAAGPLPTDELAHRTGADAAALWRVLRSLATEGVLEEYADGRFGLSAHASRLQSDMPYSAGAQVITRGHLYYRAAAALLDTVWGGSGPLERAHGETFFDELTQQPESGMHDTNAQQDQYRE